MKRLLDFFMGVLILICALFIVSLLDVNVRQAFGVSHATQPKSYRLLKDFSTAGLGYVGIYLWHYISHRFLG